MAETVRTEAVTVLPEYQETFLKDLLASTSALANMPTTIPDYQVAGMTPAQQAAIQLGISGVGAYQPMMEAGAATLGQGVAALQPGAYQQYMNPYVDQVVDQSLADLQRQADMERQRIGSSAVKAVHLAVRVRRWPSKNYSAIRRMLLLGSLVSSVHRRLSPRRIERNRALNCLASWVCNKRLWVNLHRRRKHATLESCHSLVLKNKRNNRPRLTLNAPRLLNASLNRTSVLALCLTSSVAYRPPLAR